MATVQISFTDNSNNEEKFTVYRSVDGGSVSGTTAEAVCEVSWNSATNVWEVSPGAIDANNDATGTNLPTTDPTAEGQDFVITYTEDNAGTYFYGVEAENNIGKSAIKSAPSSITIAP
jgi:hypothetical protein